MGRRKERRLVSISAAGRRVKLDLCVEPSGDLGGSSAQEELGGDNDPKTRAECPDSPSSSDLLLAPPKIVLRLWDGCGIGNNQMIISLHLLPATVHYSANYRLVTPLIWRHRRWSEDQGRNFIHIGPQLNNPLMLLEQYSNDEMDELLSKGQDAGAAKDPSDDLDETTKVIGEVMTEDIGTDDVNYSSVQVVKQLEMDNDSVSQDLLQKLGKRGTSLSYTDDLKREKKAIEEGTCAAIPNEQVGDVSSSWKKVLHEESSQYYYWNILTGETSWQVPDVLAQATVLNHPEKAVGDTSGTSVDVEQEDTFEKLIEGSEAIYKASGDSSYVAEADGFEEGSKGDSLGNEIENAHVRQNCRTSLLDAPVVNAAKYNCKLLSGDCKSGTDFSSHLVKHCDILLERLNSLESLNWNLQWQDIKLKYKLEVGIRLSDIKVLASHGSCLLQFWLHTEDQLKRIDATIDDAIRQYGSAPTGEYEATVKSQEAFKVDSNEKKGNCQDAKESNHLVCTPEKLHIEAYGDLATTTGLVSSVVNPIACSNTETEGKDEIIGLEVQSEIMSKSVHCYGEEVDMDVDMDMEVEDTSTSLKSSIGGASGAQYHILSHEQLNLQQPPAVHEPLLQRQMFSVQPPATSWIHQLSVENEPFPPPPLDNEPFPLPPSDDYPFPPPPPDEPPETSYPSHSHLESVHSLSYSEHYVPTYPSSNLDYYGHSNTEISGATLYAHPEGVQFSASHITPYYEAVRNIYPVAPLVGNPGEPSSYYGLQNGSLNPPSLVSGAAVESSRIQSETVLSNRDTDTTCSLDSRAETGYDLFPKVNPSVIKSGQGSVKEPDSLDTQPAIGSQSTTSMSHGADASSAPDAPTFVSAAAASSKVQSKVSRSKKRTVAMVSTLRSNKKVSSLVDKWKAAKEELHEEEEEPENAYEMLGRKRQREIEEWQAQQIANGEAKYNTNFQPLGGDWRERVKRAQKMKETEHNVSKPTGSEEPNLVKLSRDLPSGWQAYWDDSSKKVYYGNVVTSGTTWNKPKH